MTDLRLLISALLAVLPALVSPIASNAQTVPDRIVTFQDLSMQRCLLSTLTGEDLRPDGLRALPEEVAGSITGQTDRLVWAHHTDMLLLGPSQNTHCGVVLIAATPEEVDRIVTLWSGNIGADFRVVGRDPEDANPRNYELRSVDPRFRQAIVIQTDRDNGIVNFRVDRQAVGIPSYHCANSKLERSETNYEWLFVDLVKRCLAAATGPMNASGLKSVPPEERSRYTDRDVPVFRHDATGTVMFKPQPGTCAVRMPDANHERILADIDVRSMCLMHTPVLQRNETHAFRTDLYSEAGPYHGTFLWITYHKTNGDLTANIAKMSQEWNPPR